MHLPLVILYDVVIIAVYPQVVQLVHVPQPDTIVNSVWLTICHRSRSAPGGAANGDYILPLSYKAEQHTNHWRTNPIYRSTPVWPNRCVQTTTDRRRISRLELTLWSAREIGDLMRDFVV